MTAKVQSVLIHKGNFYNDNISLCPCKVVVVFLPHYILG